MADKCQWVREECQPGFYKHFMDWGESQRKFQNRRTSKAEKKEKLKLIEKSSFHIFKKSIESEFDVPSNQGFIQEIFSGRE